MSYYLLYIRVRKFGCSMSSVFGLIIEGCFLCACDVCGRCMFLSFVTDSTYPGDAIGVSKVGSAKDVIVSGVVLHVSSLSIKASLDDLNGIFLLDDSKQYCIMKMANDVTYRRHKRSVLLYIVVYSFQSKTSMTFNFHNNAVIPSIGY